MNVKLTLSVDSQVIAKAKLYARESGTSLSRLVENYLLNLITETDNRIPAGSVVQELGGIINLTDDVDYRKEYGKHIRKKHK